ncbi:MAG: ABC transporter permease [Mycoplasma sp.]
MDGSSVSILLNTTMLLFAVLGFGAMAGYFCERVGIVNIAIDGQMIFGAFIFTVSGMLFKQAMPNLSGLFFLIPLLISLILSVILSWVFGILVIKIRTNHVISGTAINLFVAGVGTFITAPLGAAISGGTDPKLIASFAPKWQIQGALTDASSFYGETILIFILAIVIIVATMLFLDKSRFGLRFKAIGDNPNAVDAQGINVNKYKWIAVLISGAFASVAGSLFIYGGPIMFPQSQYFEGNVGGLGFLALAIVVSGGWKIPFISLSAILFGFLVAFFNQAGTVFPDINVALGQYSKYVTKAIPFALSLVVLCVFSWKGIAAPKALGKHFDKSLR